MSNMFKCKVCGEVFDYSDAAILKSYESIEGSFFAECVASDAVCPACASDDYDEAFQCPICKEYFLDADTVPGSLVCSDCYKKGITDDNIFSYLKKHELFESVIKYILSDEEVEPFFEEALKRFLLDDKICNRTFYHDKLLAFIEDDAGHYADYIAEVK